MNKRQTIWLQELVNTLILMVYWPDKQTSVPGAPSCSLIFHDSMNKSTDSQPSGIIQKFFLYFLWKTAY